MPRTEFCRRDALACAAVLLCALALLLVLARGAAGEDGVVTVTRGGEVLWECPLLGTDASFTAPGEYPLTVSVAGGRVWISESHCPGGDCRARGAITRPGESIVCLPARVTVAITGGSLDLIVG